MSLYNDDSATETENESDSSQMMGRKEVVESSDEDDDDMMVQGGTAFQKVKRELKGVLAAKASSEPLVIDGKL